MLANTPDLNGLESTAQQAADEILAAHRSCLCELRIRFVSGGVVLCGRAVSYYGKQIAFHEMTRRCGQPVVANEIEVQPPVDEPLPRS